MKREMRNRAMWKINEKDRERWKIKRERRRG